MERNPLAAALVLSLLVHLGLLATWKTGQHFGWWNHQAEWLVKLTRKLTQNTPRRFTLFTPPPKPAPPPSVEVPLSFVEVDPVTATTEPPADARYYSSKNSKAANLTVDAPKEIPKVDGKQTDVVRLMDNEKPKPFPLQPSAPAETKPEEAVEPKPQGGEPPVDLALNKLKEKDKTKKPPSDGLAATTDGKSITPEKQRPRTLAAGRAAKGMLAGEKIKQTGGVPRRGEVSFDVKATPFGEYDRAFIAAIEQSWHNLLDNHRGGQRSGRVVLDFKLRSDGRIVDMKIDGNEVGPILGMLCQRAVEIPAPYAKWPPEMLTKIKGNTREIRFTFHYY